MNRSEGDSSNSEDGVKREREAERVEERNKKQGHRIRKLERKTMQNVNLYFIFQAVILASTSSTSTSTCHHSWIPISLSLIAAITNFLTFFADVSKILKSREQLDQNLSHAGFINQLLPGATFNDQGGEIVRPVALAPIKKWKRRFVVYLSVALFAGFSAIVMYGCHRLLCHPGHTNCVKLC